jgi:serine phosphatase RsbU (regulator of sigma subunit)
MLGGDLYDIVRRDDSGLVLVADVMGHGFEAALIAMLVKAAFQEAAAVASDPGKVLADMRRRLRRTVPAGRLFVAATIIRLDLDGPGLQLVNAGLPHPFVLRSLARRLEEVQMDGRPIGLSDEVVDDCAVSALTLARADVLFVASDGIGSIEGAGGAHFDDQRLREALERMVGRNGTDVIHALAAEALTFGRGRRLPDDVNLLTIWRPDAVAPPPDERANSHPSGSTRQAKETRP